MISNLLDDTRKEKLFLFGLFLSAIFVSLFWFSSYAIPAIAACPDPPLAGSTCSDSGDTNNNSGSPPANSNEPNMATKPRDYEKYTPRNPNNYNFGVSCSNWNGSGSWQQSSNCSVDDGRVAAASGRGGSWGTIVITDNGGGNGGQATITNPVTFYTADKSCGPQGERSAHAQTWNVTTLQTFKTAFVYKWDRATKVWYAVQLPDVVSGEYVIYTKIGCQYPRDVRESVKCFWNYGGNLKFSIDKNRSEAAWTNYGNRPAQPGDPRTPTGGSGSVAPNCDRVGSPGVMYSQDVTTLGYYRNYNSYNYKTFNNVKWVTPEGVTVRNQWSSGATLSGSGKTWWTYACVPGAANSTAGPYFGQAALPNIDAHTNPATCPQVNWQCKIGSPTIAGLDKVAVANGTVSPNSPVSVLRNGEPVPLTFATVRIVDTSTPSDIDVTNGGTSPGVRNVSSIKYKNSVKKWSTPFAGTNPNDPQQYFKLYKKTGSTTLEKFDTWSNDANNNVDKPISFYWASDSNERPFAVERQWRVTAEFLVPQGGKIGGPSATPDQAPRWKVGTYDCKDYSGRGASRVDRGILTATSNPIEVVRSAGN
jgi:hypothetical protein